MSAHRLSAPLSKADALLLRAGETILLSGTIYTARDAAHKRMISLLDQGLPLPFDPEGAVIYYVGPTPAPADRPIGAAGPTTAGRMDAYAPRLHALGIRATIGKGRRSAAVRQALCRHGAVYLGAVGGAGALLARHITAAEVVAFEELETEAVRKLAVIDLPLLVINDAHGGDRLAMPDLAAVGLE